MKHAAVWTTLATTVLLTTWSVVATAAETTVKNDSETDGSTATPCNCFLAGERVAAWLTSPVNGKLVGVQVFWKSGFGGAAQSQEMSIKVLAAGTFPAPGTILANDGGGDAEIVAPLLNDGVFNEFRHLDQAQTTPLSVSIAQGQTFVVSLEFANTTDGNLFAADAAWDADGCQAGKNAVFVIPGGWVDACPQGVAGDWVIRAIVDEVTVPVAGTPAVAALLALLALTGLFAVGRQLAPVRPA